MITWDELIDRYNMLAKATEGYERAKYVNGILTILPRLRSSVEKSFPNIIVSTVILAVELRIPDSGNAVVIQYLDISHYSIKLKNNRYQILQETEVDSSHVIDEIIRFLRLSN
jgi:hypothetical protein